MAGRKKSTQTKKTMNKKYMRKTTRKGAYRKSAKRQFQKRRAPFVETKFQTDVLVALKAGTPPSGVSDTIRIPTEPLSISNGTTGNPSEYTLLPINCFYNMNRGLEASDMIGSNIYSRYLKTKLEFELPRGDLSIRHPCDIYVIHGFVTKPLGRTLSTAPTIGTTERSSIITHMNEVIAEHFNQRLDKLEYRSKRKSQLKILGYRKLKVKKSAQLGIDTQSQGIGGNFVGSKPLINMSCNFPTKRKIHYVEGTSNNQLQFNYPNHAWLPFILIYNPTAGDFLDTQLYSMGEPKLKVRYNSIHYFSDS